MPVTTAKPPGAAAIRPFTIEIPDADLADLGRRLAATRWPTKELVEDRSQGVQLATLKELVRYWAMDYDWRKAETKLNAFPQFVTKIDGVDIHFIHVKSRHPNALPLIMTHGWPGSVIELLETVGPLTDPTAHGGSAGDAFHLVLPSLPGYGFSSEPTELGWDAGRTARAWAELMHRLGYTRYVAQGGDVGALVTDLMGRQAVKGSVGYHLNLLTAVLAIGDHLPKQSEQERAAARAVATFREDGFGYFLEMATRPQTIGYGLLDSPSRWRPGCSTMTRTAPTRSPARSSTVSPRAVSPGRPSSTTSRCYWLPGTAASAARCVLGGRTSAGRSACKRAGLLRRSRFRSASRRSPARSGLPRAAGLDGLPRPRLLQRGRPRWPLRSLGEAGALQPRAPRGIPDASLSGMSR